MDLKKYVDRRKLTVFVMVSELLERAEREETGQKRIFCGFGEMGMKRNEGQLFRLHGSTDMRVESRVRVGDRSA